jgi:hypothetical protein
MGLVAIIYCIRFETSLFVASYDSQGYGGGIRPASDLNSKSKLLYDWRFTANQFVLESSPLRLTTSNLNSILFSSYIAPVDHMCPVYKEPFLSHTETAWFPRIHLHGNMFADSFPSNITISFTKAVTETLS